MKYTEIYLSDLIRVSENVPQIHKLANCSVMITGAGGLICSAIVDVLMSLNDFANANIQVYAAARNENKINERFSKYLRDEHFNYLKYDAMLPIEANIDFDYIIHGASNAVPNMYSEEPVETMLANMIGTNNILQYSLDHNVKRILYISSSEVYGKKGNDLPYDENDYGFVDILNPRACYPSSKRAAETLCMAYEKEYGLNTVIVRPGHIYGPTMTESDNRASSQFPKDIFCGRDIIMKSAGNQLRSYCYVLDCASAVLTVLINGHSGEAYNISNVNSIATIRQVAESFAKCGGKKIVFETPTDKEISSYNLMENSCLSSNKLEDLGWRGLFNLQSGVERTLEAL
ncbi:MAG: NAD-dependent epimerase/dehydratase family protein [Eubacterium sp.]|nr:NAD-dependent epimerase/dehydratase family protein [Eubacterium sp.]